MRLVNFKSLTIKNFLSVGETPVTINFQPGVNVITGINYDKEDSKNGVGKSTIIDALYFALFGTTIRELSKDYIVNSQTKKKCEVTLDLQIDNNGVRNNYKIIRTLEPTKCFIEKDGVDITHSTLAKTNDYIQKLIHSNGKVFQNSVIMTANNTIPFMAQSKVDKRKFIESVLNLEVFSDMLLKARDEHNEKKREYETTFSNSQIIEKNFTLNKQQLEHFEDTKKNKIFTFENKITEAKLRIEELVKTLYEIPSDVNELFESKLAQLQNNLNTGKNLYKATFEKYTEIKTLLKHEEKQLEQIGNIDAICSTCNRPYSEDDIKHKEKNTKEIQDRIQKHENDLALVKKELDSCTNSVNMQELEIATINTKRNKIKEYINQNNNTKTKIQLITESINDWLSEIANVNNENNTALESSVAELKKTLDEYKIKIDALNSDLSVLECVKFVISEEGVKSYIVRKILKVLNARLAHYLEELHANCLCQFNEYFDETITDEKGTLKSYFNFSGGERKRIDLACLFAFLDIRRMQGDVYFNTIFYDELLDSSLDDKGVELVLRILRKRFTSHNESCYIITHRGNTITAKTDNTILLEKRNGFTYII